jgi:plastocyanin
MRNLVRLALALACSFPLAAASAPAAGASDGTVKISDTGFDPPFLSVPVGATVFWTNTGSKVHTAKSKLGPVAFDTGGIGNGQTVDVNFLVPGTYVYTSAVDCLNGGGPPTGFDCGSTATIAVVDQNVAYNPNAFNVTPTATATPILAGPAQSAQVQITRQGMNPPSVTIALGGSVSWINMDNLTHTVTTTGGGSPQPFDSGGLGAGLNTSFTFGIPGTYTYTSAIDCLNGTSTPGFSCGPYTVIVSPQPSALAPSVALTPVAGIETGSVTTVTIDDANGFTPPTLPIHPGQTVTWVNAGKQVHTVTSNPGYTNQFNSGGLATGQKFSYTFPGTGSFGYHSTTETNYAVDGMGNQVVQFKFAGMIVTQ